MDVESYFLRYAMPCAFIIRDMGEITDAELKELEDAAEANKPLPREKLEKIFFRAFEKIGRFCKTIGKDKWDRETIERYFKEYHNKEIDRHEGYYATCGEMNRNLSKVRVGKIIKVEKDRYIVEYENDGKHETRAVFSKLVPRCEVGEKVYIHFFFATEKA